MKRISRHAVPVLSMKQLLQSIRIGEISVDEVPQSANKLAPGTFPVRGPFIA
jgi:hypothetical protein